jgi:PEP-CTERM motif
MRKIGICLAVTVGALASAPAMSAVLFQDQMTNAAAWGTNVSSPDNLATFAYNYSVDGIPEAPNSQGGDTATSGLKLESNLDAVASAEYQSLYPLGQNFVGVHQLRFDAWMNLSLTGVGTTEFIGGGIGYDGVTADIASGAQMMATGDGGSSNDWRAFKSPPQFFIPDAAMAAGTHQGSDPYYANFLPSVAAPAVQGVGSSIAGSPGFQWITVQITTFNGKVEIAIEKPGGTQLSIVDYDCNDLSDGSGGCTTAGNISLFYADFFSSISADPAAQFGLIDNVIVTDVPEPASLALMGLGGLMMLRRR